MTAADPAQGDAAPTALPGARQLPCGLVVPGAAFLILLFLPAVSAALLASDGYVLSVATRVMIYAIAALSLDLLVGYGGLVSFGHAAFMGLGAYAVGILAAHGVSDMLISLPVAVTTAAVFAYVTGAVCLRTKGVYFIMITLAFGQMTFFLASSLAPYGGDDGLTIQARNTAAGLALFAGERSFYFLVLACLAGVYAFCRALIGARFGRVLRGTRENPARMTAMGFDIYRYQHVAYVLAGAIAGIAGFLLANATEFVSPAYMSWQRSGDLIIMVIIGGAGRLDGALLGAAVLLLVEEWLAGWTEHWHAILGPLLVLIALFARGGLLGFAGQVKRRLAGG
jgi:branched-chain amino acid transport system permease protein